MGINFGVRVHDKRDTIWKGDTSLVNVTANALEDWEKDGDASWLLPFALNGQPDVFTFRVLTLDEKRSLQTLYDEGMGGYARMLLSCFRMGVNFPSAAEEYLVEATGRRVRMLERVKGITMLSEPFVVALEEQYKGMVEFYGQLIFQASFPSEAEKKASSPQSIKTPSLAAATTSADTVEAAKKDGGAA